jgi:Protein of unknown function (DUF3667)
MSHKHHGKHHPYCLNCHYPLSEFDKNCSQCGQKPTDGKTTMHDLLHEFIHTMFHLDGKFFWTLKHLFIPGKLTLEFFKGHHKRYAHPIQLFLVVGAFAFATIVSKLHKAEEQIKESAEESKKEVLRKQFLIELDTVTKAISGKNAQLVAFRDSVIYNMLYPVNSEKTEGDIRKELYQVIEKEINKSSNNKKLMNYNFKGDSVGLKAFKDSIVNVLLKDENIDNSKKTDDEKALDENNEGETDDESTPKEDTNKFGNPVDDFKKGFQKGMKESFVENIKSRARNQIAVLKKQKNVKEAIKIEEDSISINGFFMFDSHKGDKKKMMPKHELYELTPDSILHKYPVEGFMNNVMTKQYLKTIKVGSDLFHFFMSKLFWATFAVIPALALFFLLIYRRQKHYYVEHVVFLMHYNTTIFLGLILTLYIFPYWGGIAGLFTLWVAIHFFLAIKNYYQQGWGKTFLKYFIITNVYFILSCIFMLATAAIGFLLF